MSLKSILSALCAMFMIFLIPAFEGLVNAAAVAL